MTPHLPLYDSINPSPCLDAAAPDTKTELPPGTTGDAGESCPHTDVSLTTTVLALSQGPGWGARGPWDRRLIRKDGSDRTQLRVQPGSPAGGTLSRTPGHTWVFLLPKAWLQPHSR